MTERARYFSVRNTKKNVAVVGIKKRRMVKMRVPRKSWSTVFSALSTLSLSGLYFLPRKSLQSATSPLHCDRASRRA